MPLYIQSCCFFQIVFFFQKVCSSVIFGAFPYLQSQSQKPENRGYNLMPSRDKTWICSIDSESETYGLRECLLDLSLHHLGH